MHALCLQMITRNTLVDYLRIWCQKGYPPPDPLKRPTVEGPILHQLVIFFGAHFSNLIICIENKLCKVIDDF